MHRSQVMREVETDLHQARARGMIKVAKFAGKTYTEIKAERKRKIMKVYQVLALGFAVLVVVAIALKMWVG